MPPHRAPDRRPGRHPGGLPPAAKHWMPRVIELSYLAGEAHTMFHDEMRGADDDVFRLVGHFSGYARLREVLALDVSEVMAEWAGRVSNDHWPPR
jgi:hypothetical protein